MRLNGEGVLYMAKIVYVLYRDPVGGYPPKYDRDDIPVLSAGAASYSLSGAKSPGSSGR